MQRRAPSEYAVQCDDLSLARGGVRVVEGITLRLSAGRALAVMGKSYVRFALAHPAEFRVMFGESGTTAQDPRLRLPTIPRTAYEQLEDLVGAWNRQGKHGLDVTLCARALWAGVHGLARLLLDGALVLDDAEVDALAGTLVESLLRGLPKAAAAPKRRSR